MAGGTTLANAYVQILPTTKGIKGNLQKELGGVGDAAGKDAGSRFSGMFKKFAVAGAAAAGAALTKSLLEGAALEQSLGGVETLYKNHANIVIANADKAWKTAGLSANDYMEQSTMFAASLLQSLGGDTKKAAKYADMAIIDMSDNANKMGTSIEDIQHAYQGFSKQNYTMLDNLKLGYGGTKTEMERLLSDAEKLSGQKYDISNLNDVYDAIHVIQQDLGITGTTAKEAEKTLSGSFAAMRSAANNFLGNLSMRPELIGQSMQDLVSSANTFLFDNLIPAVGNVIKALPVAVKTFMKKGIPQIMKSGKALLDSLIKGMEGKNIAASVMPMLAKLSAQLLKSSKSLVGSGMKLLQKLAEGIAKGIPVVIKYAPKIIGNLADVINKNAPTILKGAAKIMLTLAKGLIQSIPVLIRSIPQIFKAFLKVWEALNWLNLGKLALTAVKNGMTVVIKTIGPMVKSAFTKVKDFMLAPTNLAKTLIGKAITAIKSKFSFSGLAGKVKTAFNNIKTAFTSPINSAKETVSKALGKIKGLFPLKIGKIMKNLKIPKLSLHKGSPPYGFGGKGKMPSISLSWNAKAMDNPYMFSDATLFGAGEAGDEILYGRQSLMNDIAEASGGGIDYDLLGAAVANAIARAGLETVLQLDSKTIARGTARAMQAEMNRLQTRDSRKLGYV